MIGFLKTKQILNDHTHFPSPEYELLPCKKCFRIPACRTNRRCFSFIPASVHLLNDSADQGKRLGVLVCVRCNTISTIKRVLIECADLVEVRRKYIEKRSVWEVKGCGCWGVWVDVGIIEMCQCVHAVTEAFWYYISVWTNFLSGLFFSLLF